MIYKIKIYYSYILMSILSLILFGIVTLLIIQYMLNNTMVISALKINPHRNVDVGSIFEQHMFDNFIHLEKSTKKKIFIHLPYEKNERNWLDFGARSSNDLNADICMLCIQSVIRHFGDDADIVLYDNNNVKDLIGEKNKDDLCNIQNPSILSGVDLKQWESYCKAKIIYTYGGVVMEPYYFFTQKPTDHTLFPNRLTICHEANEGHNISSKPFIPTTNHLISAPKQNEDVSLYINYLKMMCVNHYSADHKHFDKTFEKLYALNYIDPKKIGVMSSQNKPIYAPDLLSKQAIDLDHQSFCLFINVPYLKKYRKHGWFLKMNEAQIKNSNTFIGEFITLHQ